MTHFHAAADVRSVLRVMPIANHFAAAVEGLGLALLAVPFALAEGLVRAPAGSTSMNVWLLRRRESDLRKLTRDVRRFLESEFAKSRSWLSGEHRPRSRPARRKIRYVRSHGEARLGRRRIQPYPPRTAGASCRRRPSACNTRPLFSEEASIVKFAVAGRAIVFLRGSCPPSRDAAADSDRSAAGAHE